MMKQPGGHGNAAVSWHARLSRLHERYLRQDRRLLWSLCTVAICAVAVAIVPAHADAAGEDTAAMIRLTLPIPARAATAAAPVAEAPAWQPVTVEPGQTLSQIFTERGFGYAVLNRLLESKENAAALRTLHPGDRLEFRAAADGALLAMRFDRDRDTRVTLTLAAGGGVDETVTKRPVERHVHVGQGTIHSSLFAAGASAGLDEAMVIELAEVFKYDIDFIKDIRKGDHFNVIYDDVWREGERLSAGRVIAAEFYNQGRRYSAYRFERPDGDVAYYDEEGRPLQRALMRTPVKFTRISSRFSSGRKHPVLGYTRAHKGVDYAAPRGTPIHAAGSGRITFRGKSRGYGNFITIKHNDTYTTAYAHMNSFAKGLGVGSRVRQGQVIGYVGMTGLATGPHLHYEVRVKGGQVNPLTMTMPKPEPLPRAILPRFKAAIAPQLAQLEVLSSNRRQLLASHAPTDAASTAGAN